MPAKSKTPVLSYPEDCELAPIAPAPENETAAAAAVPVIGTLPDGTLVRLRLHPDLLAVPSWETSEEFQQLCDSIYDDGVITPLLVHPTGEMDLETGAEWAEIVDGRHRFAAYLETECTGRHSLPCVVTERPVNEIIIRTLVERRHASKGTRAYLVWPMMVPLIKPAGRPKKELPTESVINSPTQSVINSGRTLPELAERYGFSVDLFDQARRLHEIFATRKDLKADLEPGILSGDIGLGAALAGIAGKTATENTTREDAPHRVLLERGFRALSTRFAPAKWEAMPDPDKAVAANAAVDCVLAWPAEVQDRLRKAL
jgi:hypothetical protein